MTRFRGHNADFKKTIEKLTLINRDLESKIEMLKEAAGSGNLGEKRLLDEIRMLKEEIKILRGFAGSSNIPLAKGYECVQPYNRNKANKRVRVESCVPAEGGIFDNIRTAFGGRFTNKQRCIEACHTI